MSDTPHYRAGNAVYDGTELATKLRTDLSYLVSMAILSLDTPIRTHDKPYIQVVSEDTHLHMHDEISPTAPLVVRQLIQDTPMLRGAGLKVENGFGGGALVFASTSPEVLKAELVNLRQALEDKPVALKSIHTALKPLQVQAVAMV